MAPSRSALEPGLHVTKAIELVRPLGAGGMGAVWVADHAGLQTRVVVKFMLTELDSSTQARARFAREAAAAAQVKSPHVVQMLDHGVTDENVPFIVMEHLEGKSLGQVMDERGALPPRDVVMIVSQVAKALARVHGADLLHRDIKPDNIFLCDGEDDIFVKLLDFGIVKSHVTEREVDSQTKTGQVVGTPFYMSPEQVNADKNIDARSDLWALAVVAFEALTGMKPFDGPSFGALAVAIVTTKAPKPSELQPQLPPAVDAFFERALARQPSDRFSSAKELADAFRKSFGAESSVPSSSDAFARAEGPRSLSDSGPRDGDAERAAPRSGSGPRTLAHAATQRDASNPLALDDTVSHESSQEGSQDSSPSRAALARSEPGRSGGTDVPAPLPAAGSRKGGIVIGVAAVLLLGVGAFAIVSQLDKGSVAPAGSGVVGSNAQPPSAHVESAMPNAPSTAVAPSSADGLSSAAPPASAPIANASTSARIRRDPGVAHPADATSSKPPASAAVIPTASASAQPPKGKGDILF